MTVESFHPIRARQIVPRFVRRNQQRSFIRERSSGHHLLPPGLRAATRENRIYGFIDRKTIPSFQNILDSPAFCAPALRIQTTQELRYKVSRPCRTISCSRSNVVNRPDLSSYGLSD